MSAQDNIEKVLRNGNYLLEIGGLGGGVFVWCVLECHKNSLCEEINQFINAIENDTETKAVTTHWFDEEEAKST